MMIPGMIMGASKPSFRAFARERLRSARRLNAAREPRIVASTATSSQIRSEFPSAIVHAGLLKNRSYHRGDQPEGGNTSDALSVKLSGITIMLGNTSHADTKTASAHSAIFVGRLVLLVPDSPQSPPVAAPSASPVPPRPAA